MTDQTMVGVGDGRLAAETTPETGTTTNDYVTAYSVNSQWAADATIVVTNTDASNNLTYEVLVYSHYDSGEPYTLTSGTVAHGDSDQVILVRHSRVDVRVKSAVSDSHATYQIDSLLGRS